MEKIMNHIVKSAIVCASFCFSCSLYAQLQSNTDEYYKETNLFEYGAPLTSGEVNLKNFFNNFPKFVKNAGEIELLSYQYILKRFPKNIFGREMKYTG
jgi:hypothetical protein